MRCQRSTARIIAWWYRYVTSRSTYPPQLVQPSAWENTSSVLGSVQIRIWHALKRENWVRDSLNTLRGWISATRTTFKSSMTQTQTAGTPFLLLASPYPHAHRSQAPSSPQIVTNNPSLALSNNWLPVQKRPILVSRSSWGIKILSSCNSSRRKPGVWECTRRLFHATQRGRTHWQLIWRYGLWSWWVWRLKKMFSYPKRV